MKASQQGYGYFNAGKPPPQIGNVAAANCKRICYFRMDPQTGIRLAQVDGNLCTHVILAFCRIDSRGNLVLGSQDDLAYILEVRDFKRQYPNVKVMISVFNDQEHNGFPKAANTIENRQRFARSTIEFLQHYHLDGIDLDWEFPNFPHFSTPFTNHKEQERIGLTKIIKTLRSAIVENFYDRQVSEQHLAAAAQQTHHHHHNQQQQQQLATTTQPVEPYLLTVAIAGQEAVLKASYELKQVANLCDWFNVMSYDYFLFKAYAPFTGPNSPLHSIVDPYVPILSKLSLSWTITRLLEDDIPKDKIVMGIPTYARAYKLMFKNTQPAPFTLAVGSKGGRIEDYLDYREVCDILKREGTIVEFDERARVPYLLTDDGYTWISYENAQSVREKVRHILENNLAGYMTWNLNSDDFIGIQCSSDSSLATNSNNKQTTNGRIASSSDTTTSSNITTSSSLSSTFPLHRAMFEEVALYYSHSSSDPSLKTITTKDDPQGQLSGPIGSEKKRASLS